MPTFDRVRELCAETEALATALENLIDGTTWQGAEVDRQRLEHTAVLAGLARRSAEKALAAVDAYNPDVRIPDADPAAAFGEEHSR